MLLNISTLISSIFPVGSIGLTTYISKLKDQNRKKVNYLIKYFFKLNILIVIVFIALLIPLSSYMSIWLFNDDKYYLYIILFIFSIPFSLVYSFVDLYLKGIRSINIFVLISSISSVISLMVYIPFVYFLGLKGAVISIVFAPLLNSFLSLFIIKKSKLFPDFKFIEKTDKTIKTDIVKIGLSSVVILVLQNLVYLFIRTIIFNLLGDEQVGLYQSVYTVSNNYFAIFFSLMAIYSIPRISEIKDRINKIKEINITLKFMLILYTPMILIFFVFRFQIIEIFYSSSFLKAEPLFFYQLMGDFFRVLSWVFGLWLIPSLRIKEWFIFDFIYYTIFVSIFYILFYLYNPNILYVSVAYLISYFIHFVINLLYIYYRLKFQISMSSLKTLLSSAALIIVCFFTSKYYYNVSIIVFLTLFSIWVFTVISKNDARNLLNIFKTKLK